MEKKNCVSLPWWERALRLGLKGNHIGGLAGSFLVGNRIAGRALADSTSLPQQDVCCLVRIHGGKDEITKKMPEISCKKEKIRLAIWGPIWYYNLA